jgi:predicted ATP-grasp superfamily ATP-dependent carboligase
MPDVIECGNRILHQLDYHGPAGIDFKYDPRDREFKVIEMNCRQGINDSYLSRYGLDLPYLHYLDSQGLEVVPQTTYPAGVTWYNLHADLLWMVKCRKENNRAWLPWVRQLVRGYDNYAMFSWRDPVPSIYSMYRTTARLARKAVSGRARPVAEGKREVPSVLLPKQRGFDIPKR